MVVCLFLPKRAAAAKQAVDIERAAAFPILENFAKCSVFGSNECMEMIRHYNPYIERWFCTKTTNEDVAHVGAIKKALAAARIEPLVPCFGEGGVKLVLFVIGESVDFAWFLKGVRCEPSIAFGFPFTELFLRHGVCKSGGDEVGDTGLPPVGKIAAMNLELVVWAEEIGV